MSDDTIINEGKHPVSGLTIRRTVKKAVKVVNKPRKMKLRKPRRLSDKTLDLSNSALLVFPTDRLGLTSALKKEMIRCASRIGSDPKNLELLEATLQILRGHVQARLKQNQNQIALKSRTVDEEVIEPIDELSSEQLWSEAGNTLADELGMNSDSRKTIIGTGDRGEITESDVQAAQDEWNAASETDTAPDRESTESDEPEAEIEAETSEEAPEPASEGELATTMPPEGKEFLESSTAVTAPKKAKPAKKAKTKKKAPAKKAKGKGKK